MYPNRTSTEVDDRKIIENPTYTDVNSNQQSQQNWSFMNTHHPPQPLNSTLNKEPPAGILPLEHTSMEVDDKRIMVRPVIDNIQSSVSASNPTVRLDYPTSALYPTQNNSPMHRSNVPSIEHGSNVPAQHL